MRSKGSLGNPLWNACVTAVSRLKRPLLLGPLRTVLSPKSGQICICAALQDCDDFAVSKFL